MTTEAPGPGLYDHLPVGLEPNSEAAEQFLMREIDASLTRMQTRIDEQRKKMNALLERLAQRAA